MGGGERRLRREVHVRAEILAVADGAAGADEPDPAGAAAAFPHAGGRVLRGGGGGAADRGHHPGAGDPAGEQELRRCGPDFGGLPAAECEHPHPPGRGVSQPAAEYLRPALSAVCPGPPAGF